MQRKPTERAGGKDQVVPERDVLIQEEDLAANGITPRRKLALFVELTVIRQIGLGHDPQDTPLVDHDRAVEELVLEAQGCAHQEDGRKGAALGDEVREGGLGRIEQRVLVEQVVAGIGRDAHLGKERDGGVGVRGAAGQGQRPLGIVGRIGDAQEGDTDRRAEKPMGVE